MNAVPALAERCTFRAAIALDMLGIKIGSTKGECHLMTFVAFRGAKPSIGRVGGTPRQSAGKTSNDGAVQHRCGVSWAKAESLRAASHVAVARGLHASSFRRQMRRGNPLVCGRDPTHPTRVAVEDNYEFRVADWRRGDGWVNLTR